MIISILTDALKAEKMAYLMGDDYTLPKLKSILLKQKKEYCFLYIPEGSYDRMEQTVRFTGSFVIAQTKPLGSLVHTLEKEDFQKKMFNKALAIFNRMCIADWDFTFKYLYGALESNIYGIEVNYNIKLYEL